MVRQRPLYAGGHRGGPAVGRLDHVAGEVVVGQHTAAHRSDADGLALDTQLVHALVEEPAILAAAYGGKVAPYHFDAVALERAGLGKLDGDVQRCLAAERGEQRIGLLTIEDLFDSRCGYGFDVSTISQLGIGHDGGGIAVHENDAVALLAQHLARLRARVVELARLPDDDGTRPDDEDRADVSPFRHG